MIVWTPTAFECLLCMRYTFCICTYSAQLSMFHMERRSRNTLIIIIIIIIIMRDPYGASSIKDGQKPVSLEHVRSPVKVYLIIDHFWPCTALLVLKTSYCPTTVMVFFLPFKKDGAFFLYTWSLQASLLPVVWLFLWQHDRMTRHAELLIFLVKLRWDTTKRHDLSSNLTSTLTFCKQPFEMHTCAYMCQILFLSLNPFVRPFETSLTVTTTKRSELPDEAFWDTCRKLYS